MSRAPVVLECKKLARVLYTGTTRRQQSSVLAEQVSRSTDLAEAEQKIREHRSYYIRHSVISASLSVMSGAIFSHSLSDGPPAWSLSLDSITLSLSWAFLVACVSLCYVNVYHWGRATMALEILAYTEKVVNAEQERHDQETNSD
jgi:hypothetical protein